MLTTKMFTKSNGVSGDLPDDLLEYWSQCKSQVVVSNEKSTCLPSDCLTNGRNNFTITTSISDRLQSCGNVDLNDE